MVCFHPMWRNFETLYTQVLLPPPPSSVLVGGVDDLRKRLKDKDDGKGLIRQLLQLPLDEVKKLVQDRDERYEVLQQMLDLPDLAKVSGMDGHNYEYVSSFVGVLLVFYHVLLARTTRSGLTQRRGINVNVTKSNWVVKRNTHQFVQCRRQAVGLTSRYARCHDLHNVCQTASWHIRKKTSTRFGLLLRVTCHETTIATRVFCQHFCSRPDVSHHF